MRNARRLRAVALLLLLAERFVTAATGLADLVQLCADRRHVAAFCEPYEFASGRLKCLDGGIKLDWFLPNRRRSAGVADVGSLGKNVIKHQAHGVSRTSVCYHVLSERHLALITMTMGARCVPWDCIIFWRYLITFAGSSAASTAVSPTSATAATSGPRIAGLTPRLEFRSVPSTR